MIAKWGIVGMIGLMAGGIASAEEARLADLESEALQAYDSGDEDLAMENWRLAADLGSASAMTALAGLLESGADGETDPAIVRNWYRRAAEGGDAVAMIRLAELIAADGAEDSGRRAAGWLARAAELGHPYAKSLLNATPGPSGRSTPTQ